jgi:hypothetical protein
MGLQELRTGTVFISNVFCQNYICMSPIVWSYEATTEAAESKSKQPTPRREHRKIRHGNKILKACSVRGRKVRSIDWYQKHMCKYRETIPLKEKITISSLGIASTGAWVSDTGWTRIPPTHTWLGILLRDIQLTHVQRSEDQLWKRCFLTKTVDKTVELRWVVYRVAEPWLGITSTRAWVPDTAGSGLNML